VDENIDDLKKHHDTILSKLQDISDRDYTTKTELVKELINVSRPLLKEGLIKGLKQKDLATYINAKLIENVCTSWTGLQDGKIVGCGGFTPLWDGVAEIWMYLQPDAFKRKRLALKLMKHILNDIIEREKYHRIQAVVLKDYKEGIRFAEFFKFKNEGLMESYSVDKEDVYRYARIIK